MKITLVGAAGGEVTGPFDCLANRLTFLVSHR